MTNYKVLTSEDLSELEREVHLAMIEGWEPRGGICSTVFDAPIQKAYYEHGIIIIYAQAMVLPWET
jgi:hypothetical protein